MSYSTRYNNRDKTKRCDKKLTTTDNYDSNYFDIKYFEDTMHLFKLEDGSRIKEEMEKFMKAEKEYMDKRCNQLSSISSSNNNKTKKRKEKEKAE